MLTCFNALPTLVFTAGAHPSCAIIQFIVIRYWHNVLWCLHYSVMSKWHLRCECWFNLQDWTRVVVPRQSQCTPRCDAMCPRENTWVLVTGNYYAYVVKCISTFSVLLSPVGVLIKYQQNIWSGHKCLYCPARVVRWLDHLHAMCSRAWRALCAVGSRFNSSRGPGKVRLPT